MKIRTAKRSEHDQIVKIAKQSKYTKDYTNMIFSGEDCYSSGRIRVALVKKTIIGFTCFRHRIRDKWTTLYFVGVDDKFKNKGYGTKLVDDLMGLCDQGIELKVMKDNPAVRLYKRLKFKRVGEAYDDMAWVMRKRNKKPRSS